MNTSANSHSSAVRFPREWRFSQGMADLPPKLRFSSYGQTAGSRVFVKRESSLLVRVRRLATP
jgi:hypothetical protein